MYLAGFGITVLLFFLVLEIQYVATKADSLFDEELLADLDLKQEDMIAAAEKIPKQEKQEDEGDELNKVEENTELPPVIDEPQQEEEPEVEEEPEEEPVNLNKDDPETQRIVSELPQYPGGMVEFLKWLTATLKYPPVAQRQKIEGKVIASFIVETDGSISNLKLEQKVNSYLDNEALRVLKLMPKWIPGKDHGVLCRTKVAVPVVFAI